MADNIFKVEIITPDRVFFTGEADFLEFTAETGDLGVYKNHIPMTTVKKFSHITARWSIS